MNRSTRALGAFLFATLATFAGAGVLPVSPAGAEPTGGCRSIGSDATGTSGTDRATVVIDTGSGDVWSACVIFDGTISGIEALELAASDIEGLSPLYESYPGEGRAVCRLFGVGNDPPDCLSKSVEYWSYFRNGQYARGGGSFSEVNDGDVEGWAFGRGKPPRPATRGAEAVPLSQMPSPTTSPVPPVPSPEPTVAAPAAPSSDGTAPPPAGDGSDQPGAGPDGDAGGAPSTSPDEEPSTGPAPGDASPETAGTAPTDEDAAGPDVDGSGTGSSETAAGADVAISDSGDDEGSSLASVVGFGGALGAAGVAAMVVRRRRHAAVSATHAIHPPESA